MMENHTGADVNEYGLKLDSAGYARSIMQVGYLNRCYYCGQRSEFGCLGKLERVTPWGGKNRKQSKRLGMWCNMHQFCHGRLATYTYLQMEMQRKAQLIAMEYYGWTVGEFVERFGRSEADDAGDVEFFEGDENEGGCGGDGCCLIENGN